MSLSEVTTQELMDELDNRLRQTLNKEPMKFTYLQIDHICYQIGDWYLMMKELLNEKHNLGYMKEKLKIMICGE